VNKLLAIRESLRVRRASLLPLRGYPRGSFAAQPIDDLDDAALMRLNELLPWKCFTVDSSGRRFGNRAWAGKRDQPQPLPDPRIVRLHESIDLSDKHVLEVGCFEGVHTIALSRLAAQVSARDARIENVVKTIVRCAMYGYRPDVACADVEREQDLRALPEVDVIHHVGVLYHLAEPVRHLIRLVPKARQAIFLDSHVAEPAAATEIHECDGKPYAYQRYREGGVHDVFSGMADHAKWLTLETVLDLLREHGFGKTLLCERRAERNGARVMLLVQR
jgi:tRNA (mo5U34)-methyltransferase